MQVSCAKPDYPIWYCPKYPVSVLRSGEPRPEFYEALKGLKRDVRARGLINPLIVLNHRDPERFKRDWVMTGRNRLFVVKELGWETVPAIVTGDCQYKAFPVPWSYIGEYFRDGEVYFGHSGPRLRAVARFEKGEMPCG